MLESVDINVMLRSFLDPGPWAQTRRPRMAGSPSSTCPAEATFCRPTEILGIAAQSSCEFRTSRKHTSTMAPGEHHHRSTTKQAHKPYKSKHMSKGAIKDKNKGVWRDALINFQSLMPCRQGRVSRL